jgi:hypothetical protein
MRRRTVTATRSTPAPIPHVWELLANEQLASSQSRGAGTGPAPAAEAKFHQPDGRQPTAPYRKHHHTSHLIARHFLLEVDEPFMQDMAADVKVREAA